VLLRKSELEAIKSGEVSIVFRRWRRPSVKTGGTLQTAVGVLAIERVVEVRPSDITRRDAIAAGYDSLPELLSKLESHEGNLYRIEVRFAGPDPRVRLREQHDLDVAELERIKAKLARLDSASRVGDWTLNVLGAIESQPNVAAGDLARHTGFEKDWLKTNVRKLKNLGLTISHQPGYELSPRGKVVLKHLAGDA
jgi:hypothetical protein